MYASVNQHACVTADTGSAPGRSVKTVMKVVNEEFKTPKAKIPMIPYECAESCSVRILEQHRNGQLYLRGPCSIRTISILLPHGMTHTISAAQTYGYDCAGLCAAYLL